MTYGQYPGTGGFPGGSGRHRTADDADPVNLTKPPGYPPGQHPPPRPEPYYASEPYAPETEYANEPDQSEYDESAEADSAAPVEDPRPRRNPWVLSAIVGVTVFLATVTIGGTLLAVNDSRERKAANYAEGPSTSTVTVTESVTTTETTTVTSTPSRTRTSDPYGDDGEDGGSTADTASPGWYAQYGSFTSLDSARDLANQVGAQVYDGTDFGQPGQYIVAQREYSRSAAKDACDIADQSCIVKQVQ